ncbi:MAG: CHAT domain-containing tetratricopeptide repeat protein [Myxococcota bacterium]|nr:CHAT domain-containing tetratricopeptide repeat protein [Myxococcota bacterium]
MPAPRLTHLVVAALLVAGALPAVEAAAADPAALARTAGKACKKGDLDAAAASLSAMVAELEARHGAGHEVTGLVRKRLAMVERARGREAEAARLEAVKGGESRGKPDRALQRALKKLRDCLRVAPPKPPDVNIAVRSRINLANRQYKDGQYREALRTADDALADVDEKTDAQDRMDLDVILALVNHQLGRNDTARRYAGTAERQAGQSGDLDVRIKMALLLATLGDLDAAGQALEAMERAAKKRKLQAELAEARGEVTLRLGSPREAAAYLDRALQGHRAVFGESDPSTAAVLHRLGDAQRVAGDFPAARASYEEALRIRKTKLGEAHTETAMTLNALGVLYGGLGDWQQADVSFALALAKLEPKLGKSHAQTLTVRTNRALARWGAQHDGAAAKSYAAVVEALEQALGPDHPSVAAAMRNLADMEFELGRPQRAQELVDRALAAQTRSLGGEHPDLAPTRLQRAELLAHRGALEEAASEVTRAVAALLAARGPEHPTTVHARTLLARISVVRGDQATALSQAVEASRALTSYTRHTFGAISDRQRSILAENADAVIAALLSVEQAPAREIFVALLPHRDSVLRSVAAGRAGGQGGELAALRRRYMAAVLGTGADAASRSRELADRIDALEARAAGTVRAPDRDPAEVLERACERLPDDAALVKFVAFDRSRSMEPVPAHSALVVRGAGCTVKRVDLADGDAIALSAEAFAKAMREERSDDARARRELSKLLLAPLGEALGGARRWLVVPDGALWGVPLGALPDPEAPDRYLFERVTIGYLTSTFELAEAPPTGPLATEQKASLLVGAPDFGGGERGGPVVVTARGPCQMKPFAPLPGTRREIEEVGELMGSPASLTGAQATRSAFESALGSRPWLLHFATHAYFAGTGGCGSQNGDAQGWRRDEAPVAPNPLMLSGIVLAGANEPTRVGSGRQQGILTAYEVSGLDLRSAGLVVLSACDTGTGLQRRGQEVQGLRWGFRAAGARALVTSLWLSNDVATRRLMRDFYAGLVSDEIAPDPFRGAEALRRAQLVQVESERRLGLKRPLLWANFVFSGVL